jgi:CRP/FNR family transcriptional regulator
MPCETARCATCSVRGHGLCAAFDADELATLSAIGRRRTVPAGQVLVWAGDPAAICAMLVDGALKVVRDGPDGSQHIVGLLFPGDFVGDPFALQAGESIVALADADLCVYPRQPLERLLVQHDGALRVLLRSALATLTEARRAMLMLGRRHASEKVAGFLLDMAARTGRANPAADMIELPMGRAAIGEALGLTIETVSRQMTMLKRAGLIALPGGRTVRLLDPAGLRALAG